MNKRKWIARDISRILFNAFCFVLLASCQGSGSSLEQCAIRLVEEKYQYELSDIKISPIKAGQVRIEAIIYECDSIEEMCKLGDEIGMSSGLYVDVLIESSEDRCKVLEDHSIKEWCRVACPTYQSTATIVPTITPTPEPMRIVDNHIVYPVQPGDTLDKIAEKFLTPLEWLIKSNNLKEDNPQIQAGESLIIPCVNESCLCELPGPHINMPDYFQPHPALTWVAPKAAPKKADPYGRILWMDDTHAAFKRSSKAKGEWCDVYDLAQDTSEKIITSSIRTECTTPRLEPDTSWLDDIFGEEYSFGVNIAPDGNTALVTAELPYAGKPSMGLKLGGIKLGNEVTDPTYYEQGWLVKLNERKAIPLFASIEFYLYKWADDSRHLVGIGSCYGDVGSGLFTLDTKTSKVYWHNKNASLCEGGTGPLIAPGSGHLIYQYGNGTVVTLKGTQKVSICAGYGFPRSYAWSQDGRYAYASCSGEDSDVLRRYDTQTGQFESLTDPAQVNYKAIRLLLSPDGSRLLFEWGTNGFFNKEPCGIWLLDLTKLGD